MVRVSIDPGEPPLPPKWNVKNRPTYHCIPNHPSCRSLFLCTWYHLLFTSNCVSFIAVSYKLMRMFSHIANLRLVKLKCWGWMENQFLVVGFPASCQWSRCAAGPNNALSYTEAYLQQQHTTRVICASDFGILATLADLATTLSSMSGMVIETSTCPTIIDDKMRKEMESWKGKKEKMQVGKARGCSCSIFCSTWRNGEAARVNIWNVKLFVSFIRSSDAIAVHLQGTCNMYEETEAWFCGHSVGWLHIYVAEDCFCNKKLSGMYLRY